MRKDGGCGIVMQRTLHYLTWIYAGLGKRAVKQLLRGQHTMLRIEEDHHEHLLFAAAQHQLQIIAHGTR